MYRLLKLPLRELCSKCHLSFPKRRIKLSPLSNVPVPRCSVFGGDGLSRIPDRRTAQSRFYSTSSAAPGESREQTRTNRIQGVYTSIEPGKEEEFVFLEYTEPKEADTDEDQLFRELQMALNPNEKTRPVRSDAEKQQRSLERQLRTLQTMTTKDEGSESLIEFHDVGFPLEIESKKKKPKGQHKIYGSPDVEEPISDTGCSGCGALLHCTDPDVPGYLPSEKYKQLLEEDELKKSICQRCFLLTHHQKALTVKMSKEEYRNIVRRVKPQKALVILIVDLLDMPDSIVPDLLDLVGKNKPIVVLGNKIDLLPRDSGNYLSRIKQQLAQYCTDAGIGDNVKDIHLVSAKTGYGIENLITSLQKSWKINGDVYLVGTANAGKSTMFNTLLDSDYCKTKGSDAIHKATISPWPGTTLNLLKFPIINPTPERMSKRAERLKMASKQTEDDLSPQELKRLKQLSNQGYLVGHIGRTFKVPAQRSDVVEFDADSLAYGEGAIAEKEQELYRGPSRSSKPDQEFTHNEIKDAKWLHDTPGIMKDCDVLSLLTEQEVKLVVPTQAIVPRTFVVKPGTTLFLGALGRIDYLQGEKVCWFSVMASSKVPVHITALDKADSIYQKHAGHTLLGVPMGGEDRMKAFPPLISQEVELTGKGYYKAVADLTMSSAGWVTVTGVEGTRLRLRAHAPEGSSLSVRSPSLLPHIISVKGARISKKSPAYKPKRSPALTDKSTSYKGAERLRGK